MRPTAQPILLFAVFLGIASASPDEGLLNRTDWQWFAEGKFLEDPKGEGRCLAVEGDPAGAAFVRLPFAFSPAAWYEFYVQVKFDRRAVASAVMVGTDFANRDVQAEEEWMPVIFRFAAPPSGGDHFIRLGVWRGKGQVLFRSLRLIEILPVFSAHNSIELGACESLSNSRYSAHYHFASMGTNAARTLDRFSAYFNTDRWDIMEGKGVVYCHHAGTLLQTGARLVLKTSFRRNGWLEISASQNGRDWREVGMIPRVGVSEFELPNELFPAKRIYIKLEGGRPSTRIQFDEYRYEATVAENIPDMVGMTRFFTVRKRGDEVKIKQSAGGGLDLDVDGGCKTLSLVLKTNRGVLCRKPHANPMTVSKADLARSLGLLLVDETGDTLCNLEAEKESVFAEGDFGNRLQEGTSALIWSCESARKVGRSQLPPKRASRIVECFLARNEYEAVQIVVHAKRPIRRLTAEAELFRCASGGTLPDGSLTLHNVGYVEVKIPTDERGASGPWPDPLLPFSEPVAVPAGRNQPIWVTIYVPPNCPAGDYFGNIVLDADGERFRVLLRVTVWDFTLSQKLQLQTAVGLYLSPIQRYHRLKNDKSLQQVFERYLENLAQHYLSPFDPFALSPIKVEFDKETLSARPDFTQFDSAYQRYVEGLGFNTFQLSLTGMPSGNSVYTKPGSAAGFSDDTPQYEQIMGNYLSKVRAHLASLGCLDKAYLYLFDEPEPKDYPYIRRVNERIAKEAPGLARLLTEQPEADLFGAVDIWCPILHRFRREAAEERKKAGERVWWYICTNPKAPYPGMFIDHPAVDLRVWIWMAWKYNIDGILLWSVNYWTSDNAFPPPDLQNPYKDPMSYRSGTGVGLGERAYWGNGDGRLIYPPPAFSTDNECLDAPVNSLRLEMLRDGIEDYKYLCHLQTLIEARKREGRNSLLTEAEKLLLVPEEICASLTRFSLSPEPILRRRKQLAEVIIKLEKENKR